MTNHKSDCAIHNAPALPAGQCNCGATVREKINYDALIASFADGRERITMWRKIGLIDDAEVKRQADILIALRHAKAAPELAETLETLWASYEAKLGAPPDGTLEIVLNSLAAWREATEETK